MAMAPSAGFQDSSRQAVADTHLGNQGYKQAPPLSPTAGEPMQRSTATTADQTA